MLKKQNNTNDFFNIDSAIPNFIKINIDNKAIIVYAEDKNIVDIASRNKIGIPAPCYRHPKKKGCCKACVVEIDGKQKYACGTKPENGMVVIVKRDDLKRIRSKRLKSYLLKIKDPNYVEECNYDCNCDDSACC